MAQEDRASREPGSWSAKAESSCVGRLRSAVASFAGSHGMASSVTDDVRLCVSEAVTNAVIHAFRDRADRGTVWVTAEVSGGDLVVRVRDDGLGFAPRVDSPGLGVGLSLLGSLAKEFTVTAGEAGGTVICMSFPLSPDAVGG